MTSPVLARDPTSPALVVAATRRDVPGPGCDLLVSGAGEAEWLPVEVIGELPEGLGACYAPDVGFDSQGRLEELANATERAVRFLARVAALPPSETGSFAVDLVADQRYVLADFSSAPDGTEYMSHGVVVEFRAQRQPAATPATP